MGKICHQLVYSVEYLKFWTSVQVGKKIKHKTGKNLLTNNCVRSVYAAFNLRWQSGIIIRDSCSISAYNENLCETKVTELRCLAHTSMKYVK